MSGAQHHPPEAALLGIEIGRNKVRLALLDPDGKTLDDAIERPISKGVGPRDPMEEESSTRAAIEAGLERLGLTRGEPMLVGVTMGFPHCGVGSGPALRGWLAELSAELREPIVCIGDYGVSYAPLHCIDFIRRVFEPTMLRLDRIELAPVAASRSVESLRSAAISLGSGVAWSARILERDVLEAFEVVDGAFDEILHVVSNGVSLPIDQLDGIHVDDTITRARGIDPATLAPAVGVAVALHDNAGSNLLDGHLITGPWPQAEPVSRVESRQAAPPVPRAERAVFEAGWGVGEVSAPGRIEPSPRPVTGPESTHRLQRRPVAETSSEAELPDQHLAHPDWRSIQSRDHHDDLAGIESFSPQATGLDGRGGLQVTDLLIGILLVLAVILLITLVVL